MIIDQLDDDEDLDELDELMMTPHPCVVPKTKALKRVRTGAEVLMGDSLMKQHPIHGVFAEVFDQLGGTDFLYGWAAENPTQFIGMLSRMTPALQPNANAGGAVAVTVNTAIIPGELDG